METIRSIAEGIRAQAPILLIVCVLYLVNRFVLSGIGHGTPINWLIAGYANDFMAPIAMFAIINMSFALSKRRLVGLVPMLVICTVASLVWELFGQLVRPDAVADPWDVVDYFLGSTVYWFINKGL